MNATGEVVATWVMARRRRVPPQGRGLRLLDRSQLDSTARQYVR